MAPLFSPLFLPFPHYNLVFAHPNPSSSSSSPITTSIDDKVPIFLFLSSKLFLFLTPRIKPLSSIFSYGKSLFITPKLHFCLVPLFSSLKLPLFLSLSPKSPSSTFPLW
ncbi:hypothetical protein VNO77_42049 [Canavalia gladiata]|uniref:Uncharacterized protein n=1 Tax=Canavalia gladiata TaxID=3824 RepID=A0AAN9K1N4_CANGL